MTKEELRKEHIRLVDLKTQQDFGDLLQIYQDCLFRIILAHGKQQKESNSKSDAKIVLQMVFSKISYLREMCLGYEFIASNGDKLNRIIDPTIVSSTVRTIYETVGMFNTVYVSPNDDEKKEILHKLWVIAGLSYRQKLATKLTFPENIKKAKEEAQAISNLINEIKNTQTFTSLSKKEQDKINGVISNKAYNIRFQGNKVKCLQGYEDFIQKAGVQEAIMGSMYNYFSQYSHPSNVAVFQFRDLFNKPNPTFFEMTNFNLKLSFMLVSVFIADYIRTYPEVLQIFESINLRDQCIIDYYNVFSRDANYSINNVCHYLNN